MRIVLISDTHLRHDFDVPPGDILIHAGDATPRGEIGEFGKFFAWFKRLPHAHKVFVAGNHDWLFERDQAFGRSMIPPGIVYLEDSMAVIEGLRIYGSPWTPRFLDWAFNKDRGHPLRRIYNRIPRGIDILVTHGPPLGILDQNYHGEHVGSAELKDVVWRVKPKLHVFGHIHQSPGTKILGATKKILFVNAAICDGEYEPTNPPTVVEWKNGVVELISSAEGSSRPSA